MLHVLGRVAIRGLKWIPALASLAGDDMSEASLAGDDMSEASLAGDDMREDDSLLTEAQ